MFNQTSQNVKGLKVKNRLGLAAGLDKNGKLIKEFSNIGFGFIEVGTITPHAQSGNPKPRLHRIIKHGSLLNSLGFPNDGLEQIKQRLLTIDKNICLGINIGPNKDQVAVNALDDYITCYKEIYKYAHFVTLNISSPNTPGLRDLHSTNMFQEMIEAIIEERDKNTYKPKILIKFSPDESLETYKELLSVINASEIDGVIITNTTNNGELKNNIGMKDKPGGISGKLLREPSNKILKAIKPFLTPEKIIVAVGGVYDVDSYNEKIDLGADLVQMYTGLIYEGPSLVKRIVKNDK